MPAYASRDHLFLPGRHHRGYQTTSPIRKPEKNKPVPRHPSHNSTPAPRRARSDSCADPTEKSRADGLAERPKTVELRGEAAIEFVKQQIEAGNWQLKLATALRRGFQHSLCGVYRDEPSRYVTYEFVIDGTEKSCFAHKEVIKSAGYDHYSAYTRYGWQPFKLDESGKIKGFGRYVSSREV